MKKLSADQPQGVKREYHTTGRTAEFTQLTAPAGTVKTSQGECPAAPEN